MYGSIGFTRRDKTPLHWQNDYRLTLTAKKTVQSIAAEREQLFKAFEALPDDISDNEYNAAERELRVKLDALIEREDEIRKANRR